MGKKNPMVQSLRQTLGGEFVVKHLPFAAFLVLLGLIYIANSHYSERTMRDIHKLEQEIRQLRWQYLSIESETLSASRASELAGKVASSGLVFDKQRLRKISMPHP